MSVSKVDGVAGAVLRNGARSTSSRKLPVFSAAKAGSSQSQQDHLEALRATFAAEIEAVKAEAFKQGLAEGREKAAKLLEAERVSQQQALTDKLGEIDANHKLVTERLQSLVCSLESNAQEAFSAMEPIVARLAYAAVVKMLGAEWKSQGLLAKIAASAIQAYKLKPPFTIFVSKSDLQQVLNSSLPDELPGRFEADAGLSSGSCVIHFDTSELDLSLELQLAALRKALIGETEHV